jgi:hypothetical protein
VIPGTYQKQFPAGSYGVSCALIIGQRKPSTDLKTCLNDALRDFNVADNRDAEDADASAETQVDAESTISFISSPLKPI